MTTPFSTLVAVLIIGLVLALSCRGGAAKPYVFEDLGRPFEASPMAIEFVSKDGDGRDIAWGRWYSKGENKYDVFGVYIDTGECFWLGLQEKFGTSYIQMHLAENGNVYLYSGSPSHFSKYDLKTKTLVDLGVPTPKIHYFFGKHIAPDGKFY